MCFSVDFCYMNHHRIARNFFFLPFFRSQVNDICCRVPCNPLNLNKPSAAQFRLFDTSLLLRTHNRPFGTFFHSPRCLDERIRHRLLRTRFNLSCEPLMELPRPPNAPRVHHFRLSNLYKAAKSV
jgi:hypothetical protein